MKTTNLLPGLALLFAAAFSATAQTITTTPTNGPTTITVHAHTKDGKVPVGVSCSIAPILGFQRDDAFAASTNGEWTAANVRPGDYGVMLRSPNYADLIGRTVSLQVMTGTNYTVDYVLRIGEYYDIAALF